MKLALLPLFACSLISFASAANENSKFNEVYQAYQAAYANDGLTKEVQKLGKQSYELGCEVYGQQSKNCIALLVNYADMFKGKGGRKELSLAVDKQVTFEKESGDYPSIELAEYYIRLAKKYRDPKKANKLLSKATNIARESDDSRPLDAALIRLEAGKKYLQNGDRKSKLIVKAHKILEDQLPVDHQLLIESRFWLGKYYRATKKVNKSITLFEENLKHFDRQTDFTHPYELTSRAFLVDAYSKIKKPDEATKHCIAIGEMKPWDESQEQIPLFRVHPKYPMSMARLRKEGWIKLKFDISETGTVRNIEIIDASREGFEKVSKEALEQWRYAPKFKNGKAVVAEGLSVQLDFKMG